VGKKNFVDAWDISNTLSREERNSGGNRTTLQGGKSNYVFIPTVQCKHREKTLEKKKTSQLPHRGACNHKSRRGLGYARGKKTAEQVLQ